MGELDFWSPQSLIKAIAFFVFMPFSLETCQQERKRKTAIPQKRTTNVVVKIYNDKSCFPPIEER